MEYYIDPVVFIVGKKTIQGKFQCSDQAETVAKLKANQQAPGMTQIRPKHGN